MLDILNCMLYIYSMSPNPIRKSRFTRPVFLWAMAALLTALVVRWLGDHARLTARELVIGIGASLLLMLLFAVSAARMILKMDELQKRICVESLSIAFLLTLVLTAIFVGLELAGLHRQKWDDLGSYMMLLWACAYVFSVWRYR
jgi:FtsH-binding integral membrane protein